MLRSWKFSECTSKVWPVRKRRDARLNLKPETCMESGSQIVFVVL